MPSCQFETNTWSHISNIKLADEQFNIPGKIYMLLGAEIFSSCLKGGCIVGSANEPIALETYFGWVLMGQVFSPLTSLVSLCAIFDGSLDNILKGFWELEEPPQKAIMSDDDMICEQNFTETHFRIESGRYYVSLPFKEPNPRFLDNRSLALWRFLKQEYIQPTVPLWG